MRKALFDQAHKQGPLRHVQQELVAAPKRNAGGIHFGLREKATGRYFEPTQGLILKLNQQRNRMKKMSLKLDNYDVDCWIDFIKRSIACTQKIGYTKSYNDMLVLSALCELLEKLISVHSPFKSTFKLKISKSHGLAFLVHCTGKGKLLPGDFDNLTLNKIIGQIDKQKND